MKPPRVGISSCLLGERVRYDGAHKRTPLLLEFFEEHVEWVSVCPEFEVGMGVPREPVQLVQLERVGSRLVGVATGRDWTEVMLSFSARKMDFLQGLELCGYVLKSRSPSCGLDVPLHAAAPARGPVDRRSAGLFAGILKERFVGLPIREESDLADVEACTAFLEEVRRYRS